MAEYSDHIRIAKTLLDKQAEVNALRAERDVLAARVAELEQPKLQNTTVKAAAERLTAMVSQLDKYAADHTICRCGRDQTVLGEILSVSVNCEMGHGDPIGAGNATGEDLRAVLTELKRQQDVQPGPVSAAGRINAWLVEWEAYTADDLGLPDSAPTIAGPPPSGDPRAIPADFRAVLRVLSATLGTSARQAVELEQQKGELEQLRAQVADWRRMQPEPLWRAVRDAAAVERAAREAESEGRR